MTRDEMRVRFAAATLNALMGRTDIDPTSGGNTLQVFARDSWSMADAMLAAMPEPPPDRLAALEADLEATNAAIRLLQQNHELLLAQLRPSLRAEATPKGRDDGADS